MKILNKIWPWSVLDRRLQEIIALEIRLKVLTNERDEAIGRGITLETRISELKDHERKIKVLEGHNAQLTRQVGEYRQEAAKDVRSGYIMADKQQATDIKFRSVKVDLQVMKKICKQASGAIRYAAQQVKDNKVQGDLRRIAELIHPDAFNTMGIENMRSADMVETTGSMRELVGLSNGRIED